MNLIAHDIIIRPVITEKSSRLMEMNKYTFEVHPSANQNVNVLSVHAKPKRMGVFQGKTRSWKKAIVSLAQGERIEFFEGASI